METKRCQRCHKLLRAEAPICTRCGGYDFLSASQAKPRQTGDLLSGESASTSSHDTRAARTARSSSPSHVASPLSPLPPTQLSPHRAGHYSGLHPEDEPYQSSFLPVLRMPLSEEPALDVEEVEDLAFSTVPEMPGMPGTSAPAPVPAPTPAPVAASPQKRQVASLAPLPQPRQQRSVQTMRAPVFQPDETTLDQAPARSYEDAPTIPNPRPRRPARRQQNLAVRLLFIVAIFLFVVATSILVFLLAISRPPLALKPALTINVVGPLLVGSKLSLYGSGFETNAVVTITRDGSIQVLDSYGKPLLTTTYDTGNFVVLITIGDWGVGPHTLYATDQQGNKAFYNIQVQPASTTPPQLKLSPTQLDMGENVAGVVTHKNIALTGDGKVNWQGNSDSPWLTLTPLGSSFVGGQEVVITADRSNLPPGSYKGHITFTQLDSKTPARVLTVTMGVNPPVANPAAANLVISNAAFTFSGNPVTNPAAQTITIQNTGGQGLNWTANASTASAGNWLALSATGGYLAAGASSTMSVIAISNGLSVGTYQGTITFSYGGVTATPVTVTLTVNPPPVAKIALSLGGLSFHAIMGQNPPAQSFTITNTGSAPLNWGILEDTTGKTYAPVSQSSGTLAPGKSAVIIVTPSLGQASAGTLNALITVKDTDAATTVTSQQIKLTLTIVNQAIISLDQYQMTFDHSVSLQINISTQLLTITNTGSAPLNWSLAITNSSTVKWLSVDNSGGTGLQPGGADFINVKCDSTNLSPGTYTATLTITDNAKANPSPPQIVTVTVVVSA